MPNVIVSLTIPEAELTKTLEATRAFTGLRTAGTKELLAATVNEVVIKWERETHIFTGPGIS